VRIFALPPSYSGEDHVVLEGKDHHYLCRVLRLKEGDSLAACDSAGASYHCTIEEIRKDGCRLRVQRKGASEIAEPEITLFQCLPKGRKLDDVIRQAVETGVARIVPVESRYSVPKAADKENRRDRWLRIAREAAQQSGAPSVPDVSSVIAFRDIPGIWGRSGEKSLGLFFHQAPLETSSLHEYLSIRRDAIAAVIGPEGGLADEEVAFLRTAGFVSAYLGSRVLRTETAPVFALGALRVILLERKTWKLDQ